jgi:hypothetical protein
MPPNRSSRQVTVLAGTFQDSTDPARLPLCVHGSVDDRFLQRFSVEHFAHRVRREENVSERFAVGERISDRKNPDLRFSTVCFGGFVISLASVRLPSRRMNSPCLDGWPTFDRPHDWVPHLRDGLIVDKVGHFRGSEPEIWSFPRALEC